MGVLNFVLGTASMDHQEVLVNRLAEELAANPTDRFFYLVPNHIKFASEVSVLQDLQKRQQVSGTYAQSQVQILSLSRLAWYLLRDTGTYQTEALSTVGANMLMTSIVQHHQAEMGMYANEVNHAGFVGHLTSQVNQLIAANLEPDDLRKLADQAPANQQGQSWVERLKILAKVEEWYGQASANYSSVASEYQQLIDELGRQDFSDCHFYFDRFTQFTSAELAVVKAMIVNGASTTISLNLDQAYRSQTLPAFNNLFYTAGRQYARLWRFAQQDDRVTIKADLRANHPRVAPDLLEVERAMVAAARYGSIQPVQVKKPGTIECITAADRTAELKLVVTKIRQLVAEDNYRYRDILVLTRHLADYANVIEPLFAQQDVPVFNDHEKQMVNHPLVVLIHQLFQLVKVGFRTETVMAILKTGLLIPQKMEINGKTISVKQIPKTLSTKERQKAVSKTQSRLAYQFMDDVFVTENWCLKYGINENDWLSEKPWNANLDGLKVGSKAYQKFLDRRTAALNRVKDYVQSVLVPVVNRLAGSRSNGSRRPQQMTGREFAATLYQFLTSDAHVTTQLKRWARGMARTDLAKSKQSQQVWQELCGILDQFVDILGDENKLTPQEFGEVLNNGMQAATYSQIPSTLDQVLISETGIIQDNHRKVVFIIGATDDVMPETKKTSGLLNDAEIDRINEQVGHDRYLPQSVTSRIKNEPFLAYLSMMMGTEKLIMSAPLVANAEDNNGLALSPYMLVVAQHFGLWDAEQSRLVDNPPLRPSGDDSYSQVKSFVGSAQSTVGPLLRVLRQAKEAKQSVSERRKWQDSVAERKLLGPAWAEVYGALQDLTANTQWESELNHLRAGLYYSNQTTRLTAALATALYTVKDSHDPDRRILRSSISGLQTYYRNPYQYFLQYGLGLQEREQMEIKPSNTGTFFHDGLAELLHLAPGKDLTKLDEQQVAQLAQQSATFAIKQQPDLKRYADRYARFRFQLEQMNGVVATMAQILKLQADNMKAVPFVTEQPFGSGVERDEDATVDLNQISLALSPLQLSNETWQRSLAVRGRIDRIDKISLARNDQAAGDQFMVVDYKSSDHPFDLANALGGIDLQILAYLNAIKDQLSSLDEGAHNPSIVGANYLHLHKIRVDHPFKFNDLVKANNYQFHGVTNEEPGVIDSLHDKHNFFGFSVTKKGKVSAKSGSLLTTPDEFQRLLDLNRQLLLDAANQILDGNVALHPYRKITGSRQETGLDNSAYADIFRFDNVLDQQLYRELQTDKDQLTGKLKGEDK